MYPLLSLRVRHGDLSEAAGLASIPLLGMIVPEMKNMVHQPPIDVPRSGIADVLFTPVQQRVLALLFGQPDRKYQSGELIRLAGSGTGAVHRLHRTATRGLACAGQGA